jgi:uncharacterized MnhB-related membrane protein
MDTAVLIEWAAYALQGILILLAIAIVLHKNNGTIIILIASFSLVTASLYIINRAPDVAIAEIAIGSAIIPLIYVISISRQREFIVLDRVMDEFIIIDDKFAGIGYVLLHRLAEYYHLELNITNDPGLCRLDEAMDRMLCEQTNVDLIISKDETTGHYVLKGKRSSTLMKKLEQMASVFEHIDVILFKDSEFGG